MRRIGHLAKLNYLFKGIKILLNNCTVKKTFYPVNILSRGELGEPYLSNDTSS